MASIDRATVEEDGAAAVAEREAAELADRAALELRALEARRGSLQVLLLLLAAPSPSTG